MRNLYLLFIAAIFTFITPPVMGANTPLTEQECVAFAKKIEKEMKDGHPESLTTSFDIGEFMKIVDKGIANPKYRMANDKSFREGFDGKFKFGEEVYAAVKDGGYYSFLKYYSDEKSFHVVFRLFSANVGLNYHDFELIKKDGKIKIVDCFVLVTGETLTTTVRNLLLQFLAANDNDEKSQSLFKDLKSAKEVNRLLKSDSYEEALEIYKTTSEDFKTTKMGRINLILILVHTDQDEYVKKIDEYEKKYPNDPSLSLILLDGYFLRENYDKALECLQVLEKNYGADFVLEYYKANIFSRKAEYSEASKLYEKATLGNNTFRSAYESWLITSLNDDNYQKAYELSKILNERFSISKKELKETFESYPDFQKSAEYKKTLKELK